MVIHGCRTTRGSVQKSKFFHSTLDADRQYKPKMHKIFYSLPLAGNMLAGYNAAIKDVSFYCKLMERSIVQAACCHFRPVWFHSDMNCRHLLMAQPEWWQLALGEKTTEALTAERCNWARRWPLLLQSRVCIREMKIRQKVRNLNDVHQFSWGLGDEPKLQR